MANFATAASGGGGGGAGVDPSTSTSVTMPNHNLGHNHLDDLDIIGGVLMENGGMMSNQRSGSYSNLYPEGDLSQQQQQQQKIGGESSEGHYSNLPQLMNDSRVTFSSGIHSSSSVEDIADLAALASAQQHVYSNINGEGMDHRPVGGINRINSNSSIQEQHFDVAREADASMGNGGMGTGGLSWRDTSSSTLMADDLDLDDLSTVATAFQGKKTRTGQKRGTTGGSLSNHSNSNKGKSDKMMSSDSSVSSVSGSSRQQPETSTPIKAAGGGKGNKKHIIPIVAVIETSNNVNNVLNCPRPESEMTKHLHDTTMIDCALDLDSLDTVMETGHK